MSNPVEARTASKPPQSRVFILLLSSMLLITFLLIGQWLWLTHSLSPSTVAMSLPSERAPLIDSLLRQKAIVWSLILSAATMLIALFVAVSPLPWWIRLRIRFGQASGAQPMNEVWWGQEPQSAEEWVAAQAALAGAPPSPVAGQPGSPPPDQAAAATVAASGQPPQPGQASGAPGQQPPSPNGQQAPGQPAQQSGAPGQPPQAGAPAQPGVPQPGQPIAPGQQPPPPNGQQAPGQPAAPGQQPPQPGAPGQQSQQDLQQLLAQNETLDVKELTDIGDILSSFKENDEIPPHLLALSQSLGEIDGKTLLAKSERVAAQLKALNASGSRQAASK